MMSTYYNNNADRKQQENNELTKYLQILKQLVKLRAKVEERIKELSAEKQQAEQKQIDWLFEQALSQITSNPNNINMKFTDTKLTNWTLIELAAYFSKAEIIVKLLSNRLIKLLENPKQLADAIKDAAIHGKYLALKPLLGKEQVLEKVIKIYSEYLSDTIYWAAKNGHTETLKLLVTKDILEKLRYHSQYSKDVFETIENDLAYLNTDDCSNSEIKNIATKALAHIAEIKYLEKLNQLADLTTDPYTEQDVIRKLFDEASAQITRDPNSINIKSNTQVINYTLISLAAYFGKDEIIKHLLTNHPETVKEEPEQLGWAIKLAAKKGHDKALGLLLEKPFVLDTVIRNNDASLEMAVFHAGTNNKVAALKLLLTKNILDKLQKQSPKTLQEIEKQLKEYQKAKDITPEVKQNATEGLKIIQELRNRKTVKTALVAGGVVAGGASAVVVGTFVGALLAKKGLNLVKDTRLVTNHLLPAFNKVNDQLMRISSKLDLNKLAKAFTDPKIAALMIGMAAILRVISSIVVGVGAHKLQGGTILGR